MSFIITGLSGHQFSHLYGLNSDNLIAQGALRVSVDQYPGFPDRITLRDIPVGENALLLNHQYLDTQSPYKGAHAIFIWEGQFDAGRYSNILPEIMERRILSLRGFDSQDMLIDARLAQRGEATAQILSLLSNDKVEFILAHNAKQGCFSCRIERD